ncbi:MAG: HU family DNA-binding protein [Pseudomonadota bacterium]|nr:HU family DNA-binding protein [Gammaproteobacteria bacterium]MBU1559014.1 HU family DNA-binding protein [Gammaproteobacteria bacterium]MBU1926929.1 HU family DNA-binding protein [Gammaproteobacteria bacterium]MBU2546555.1 HU family DNA-binding protein [Gammaproteobacteria bacterium]
MIKSQLVERIGRKLSYLSEKDITLCVNNIIDSLIKNLSKGKRIEIRDFGSFDLNYHAPRLAHNPKTGEKLITDPKYVAHFKPGKDLKERINASTQPIRAAKDEESEE